MGDVEVFELTRRLGHRVGLASWGGPGSAMGQRFDRLAKAFDALDGSESFVHPDAMAHVAATAKVAEYEALAVITDELGDALRDLPGSESDHPLFARVAAAWADEPLEDARVGVARDVALIHIASMSNLFAAMGWSLVDLLSHPDEAQRVRAGDQSLAEACALESIRLAQRSIMARFVIAPVTLDVGTPGTTWRPASPSPPFCRSPIRVRRLAWRCGIRASGTDVGWPIHRCSARWSW
jgi:cytochrome P450